MLNLSTEPYQIEYTAFLAKMDTQETSPEEVGKLISRLAAYYANKNAELCIARRRLSIVAQDINSQTTSEGKPITSAKADVFVSASEEHNLYEEAKVHVVNLDMYISCLRSLQRGLMKEFSVMNGN